MAQLEWDSVIARLTSFPCKNVTLRNASAWEESQAEGLLTLSFVAGAVFESCRVQVTVAVGAECSRVYVDDHDDDLADGVLDAIVEANSAIERTGLTGPTSVRSAILRLCDALYIELNKAESDALAALRDLGSDNDRSISPALAPPVLERGCSGASTQYSYESDKLSDKEDEDMPPSQLAEDWPKASSIVEFAPTTEDAVLWSGIVAGLKKFPGDLLQCRVAGSWDGREGLLEIALQSRDECYEWQVLEIVVIAGLRRTTVEFKGAQAIPETVRQCVKEANSSPAWGVGPSSVGSALLILCDALCVCISDTERAALKALGDRTSAAKLVAKKSGTFSATDDLAFEMKAVEALSTQLGLIQFQIQHIKDCLKQESKESLQYELKRLERSQAEVMAEKKAAGVAVEAVMMQCTTTSGSTIVTVEVDIADRPSQSIRGHGINAATKMIQERLANSGPWAHYAAYQFSSMLAREQDLHGEYICLYHSYSQAALLYEVYAEIARHIYGLPTDFPPVPRISTADPNICRSVQALQALGGKDADTRFQALGLSSSCSIFASGSEAPPLQCFQGGYSAANPVFSNLIRKNLQLCGITSEGTLRAVETVSQELSRGGAHLTGYMLQIFIHRSICEDYTYPSKPFGVAIPGRMQDYLDKQRTADGQARILFEPDVFLDPSKVKLYYYCARPLQSCMDADVPGSRGSVIQKLRDILGPELAKVAPEVLAAKFNGSHDVRSSSGREAPRKDTSKKTKGRGKGY